MDSRLRSHLQLADTKTLWRVLLDSPLYQESQMFVTAPGLHAIHILPCSPAYVIEGAHRTVIVCSIDARDSQISEMLTARMSVMLYEGAERSMTPTLAQLSPQPPQSRKCCLISCITTCDIEHAEIHKWMPMPVPCKFLHAKLSAGVHISNIGQSRTGDCCKMQVTGMKK